jgi:transposase
MKRAAFGASSETGARLIDQLEMQLDELVATASEGKVANAIEQSTLVPQAVTIEEPQKPARRPLDAKLPRERVIHNAPCACRHCGSATIRKLDEKITETLEFVPERWKVIQHVREVFRRLARRAIAKDPRQ